MEDRGHSKFIKARYVDPDFKARVLELEEAGVTDIETDPAIASIRHRLYNRYVSPNINMVYKLVKQYCIDYHDIKEYYTVCLITLFRGIHTYNPRASVLTWIHIVTKRQVWELDRKKMTEYNARKEKPGPDASELDFDRMTDDSHDNWRCFGIENYRQFYNDDILEVIDLMPGKLSNPLIMQQAGYSLREIARAERLAGRLDSESIDTVKSRLFEARKILRIFIDRNGDRISDIKTSAADPGDCGEDPETWL